MPASTSPSPRARVPVEHRLLGLDKRTFPPALFVIVVFLVATVLIPRIDDSIDWDDPVRAGEELALTETLAFTPMTGWNVESGYRLEDGSADLNGEATVAGDGVTFDIKPDDFEGTPRELLAQVEKVTSRVSDPTFRAEGEPTTVTTRSGEVGVVQGYSSDLGDGVIAAFVIDGTGLKVTAFGPPAQMRIAADQIDEMIASIRSTDDDGTAEGSSE